MSDNFKNLSRRDFLKGMAYGAAALSSLQFSSCSYEVKPSRVGAKGILQRRGSLSLLQ